MIIFEGPDGSGKSTLMHQLNDELKLPIAPRVVSKETEAMVDLQTWVDQNLETGFQPIIYDRHRLISEPIYGPTLRGTSQEPGFSDVTWLAPRLRQFYELKPVIIYCLPPLEVVQANLKNDPDNTRVLDKIEAIYTAYVARIALDYSLAPGKVYVWDYTRSLKIKGKPAWFGALKLRLAQHERDTNG